VTVSLRALALAPAGTHLSSGFPLGTVIVLFGAALLVLLALTALWRVHRNDKKTESGEAGSARVIGRFPRLPRQLPLPETGPVRDGTRSKEKVPAVVGKSSLTGEKGQRTPPAAARPGPAAFG
jgi:hypothetical protein